MGSTLTRLWEHIEAADKKRIETQLRVPDVETSTAIAYLNDGNPLHVLSISRPKGTTGQIILPVIVDIHGGGHMYGDLLVNRNYCEYLASQGFAVVNICYRLLPEVDLAGMIQDLWAAFEWLAQHASEELLDLQHCFITGDSAGAHLSMLALCIGNKAELQQIYGTTALPLSFKALAVSCPVTNLAPYYAPGVFGTHADAEMRQMFLGKQGERAPWAPYMSINEVLPGVTLPPVLVIGSAGDSLKFQTQALLELLKKNDSQYETLIWDKKSDKVLGHVFNIGFWDQKESLETNDAMLEFFLTYDAEYRPCVINPADPDAPSCHAMGVQ